MVYDDDIFGAISDDDDDGDEEEDDKMEERGVKLLASLIRTRLEEASNTPDDSAMGIAGDSDDHSQHDTKHTDLSGTALRNKKLAHNRFMDLTGTAKGERVLEELFQQEAATSEPDQQVVQAAIMALQSVLILGTQVGVKGSPKQLQRMIAHLDSRGDQEAFLLRDLETWDTDSVRRLKYRLDRAPALQVLSELLWRQSTQGASELLVGMGAWGKHEDLPLLRSGFSIRFGDEQLEAAEEVSLTLL